jgi:hypothetical protein
MHSIFHILLKYSMIPSTFYNNVVILCIQANCLIFPKGIFNSRCGEIQDLHNRGSSIHGIESDQTPSAHQAEPNDGEGPGHHVCGDALALDLHGYIPPTSAKMGRLSAQSGAHTDAGADGGVS